jgi:hypothetical protein
VAPTRFTASAGFTMPSMIPKAVRISAMIASDPKSVNHPCIKFDPFILQYSFLPADALSFTASTATVGVGKNPRAIELDFGLYSPGCEVRCPEGLHRLFALRGERREVATFKSTKTKRDALQREAMLLTEMSGKFTGAR